MNKLQLRYIEKTYGANTILKFDELTVNSGVYWLKGGNGTGKTTLFRVITGQTPFKGDVILDNVSLRDQSVEFRSKISYAEAEPQYPPFITGNELLNFYNDVRSASAQQPKELSDLFGMTDFLDQKIGGYSSGMLKKLSLICAFIGEVDLYILDEPLITIDIDSANKLYQLIVAKVGQGKSFLLSSHQEIDSNKLNLDGVFEISNKQVVKC